MERYIVIDNYCGWPKLTLMPDGGRSFSFHGVPILPKAEESRIDEAAGVGHRGYYHTIVDRRTAKENKSPSLAHSEDSGKTFVVDQEYFTVDGVDSTMLFPYGSVIRLPDNKLAFNFWLPVHGGAGQSGTPDAHAAYICLSGDDGRTWSHAYRIDTGINETALLFYDDNNGIAVARMDEGCRRQANVRRDAGGGMRLYRTADGGRSWTCEQSVSGPGMLPAHLLKLSTGETLMSYGMRYANVHGVAVMLSPDNGLTWGEPSLLVEYPAADSGYPSTVEMPDGSLVTAYYSRGNQYHTRYYVGTILWRTHELMESRWIGRPAKFWYGTDEEITYDWRNR
ncbi:MAG: sialidase family protein [Lentisphaeria bacterium]